MERFKHFKLEDITKHLNFFRYHLLLFTFIPLIFACIFYAGNEGASGNANAGSGIAKVEFIDCLFMCYSAMTVTGLVTVNVSAIHPFQQALLYVLFIFGDYTFVSLVMVFVRKRFFRNHCEQMLRNNGLGINTPHRNILERAVTWSKSHNPHAGKTYNGQMISEPKDARAINDFVDEPERHTDSPMEDPTDNQPYQPEPKPESGFTTAQNSAISPTQRTLTRGYSTQGHGILMNSPESPTSGKHPYVTSIPMSSQYRTRQMLRERTRTMTMQQNPTRAPTIITNGTPRMPRSVTMATSAGPRQSHVPYPHKEMHAGFGGFSYPPYFIQHLIPTKLRDMIKRNLSTRSSNKLTLLINSTISPEPISSGGWMASPGQGAGKGNGGEVGDEEGLGNHVKHRVAKWMPASMQGLVIGRNSRFFTEELDDEEIEKLGGVEYKALKMLSVVIPIYIFLIQAIPFAILIIYINKVNIWDSAFQASPGVQAVTVKKSWWSLFLITSAYSSSGMSLVDQGMIPFGRCYLAIYIIFFVIIFGNHAWPMMLRFVIWVGTKITSDGETNRTLHFLLDHPRRCYLYLFPSHQSWYLLFILVVFTVVEMWGFLALDIGLPVLEQLRPFERFSDALLQSASVRASGFGVVPVANLAPAVLFLYVILMYVAIYPIALSVRSTNVYEEQALGVFNQDHDDLSGDNEPAFKGKRREIFGKYLWWHMRRQLAFDIWPLTLAIFVIACFERGKLLDPNRSSYFTIFRIIFECVSAYSTIGLTMGTPNNNYSFAGEFSTVSKIIMILVMLRGRHRGLPLAIDRAIILPHEFANIGGKPEEVTNGHVAEVHGEQPHQK